MLMPLLLSTGCVDTRPRPVVYTPATVVVTPTSDRPAAARVYPEPSAVVRETSLPTPSVAPGDLVTAETIRKMFAADPDLADAARNVRISVVEGRATMTGSVATEQERDMLRVAIGGTPGVFGLRDRLRVTLNK